ncbi:MAG: hypothetical protein LM632_10705 [Armatimonadetes bacterium]|nr:hypothetical protein [Armatimonadota bacterium]
MRRKFFGSAGALPSRKPLAIRYSLPFWLVKSLALPLRSVPRPSSHAPSVSVPCPLSHVPL